MTDAALQTAIVASVPTLAVLIGILLNNSRLSDVNGRIADLNGRIADLHGRIGDLNDRITELRAHFDARLDNMRDLWRAELQRVEEVIDARLKHLEEHL